MPLHYHISSHHGPFLSLFLFPFSRRSIHRLSLPFLLLTKPTYTVFSCFYDV